MTAREPEGGDAEIGEHHNPPKGPGDFREHPATGQGARNNSASSRGYHWSRPASPAENGETRTQDAPFYFVVREPVRRLLHVNWERDQVPEHLWLAALADTFSLGSAHEPYSAFLDAIDEFWDGDWIVFGLLSDFGVVSESRRIKFKEKHRDLIRDLFHIPVGRVLAFYPDCQAAWLIDKDVLDEQGRLDPEVEPPGRRGAGSLRILPSARWRASW